jgi:uncharacterized protein (TIGR03437 family)
LTLVARIRRSVALKIAPLAFAAVSLCSGQGLISTIAGTRYIFPTAPQPALSAPIGLVTAIAADPQGNIYVGDSNANRVYLINSQGQLTMFAGNGVNGYSGDGGQAVNAAISGPTSLVFDAAGSLYVSDSGNFLIRKITRAGVISTFAGSGLQGYSGDGGPALAASFGTMTHLAIDSSGNVYISDADNHRVRRVTSDGKLQTYAGNGANAAAGDNGPALRASLMAPQGLAFDSNGNLYIADSGSDTVRMITPGGIISTVAGNGATGETGNGGPAVNARLNNPVGVAVDRNLNFYIADSSGSTIRQVNPQGLITLLAGQVNQVGMSGDGGPAASASLFAPLDLAFAPNGALLIADSNNFRARQIANATISTIAGNGNYKYGGDGGPSTSATLGGPTGVVADSAGNVNICDNFANRVRTINPFGIINLTAGISSPGYNGEFVPALQAAFADCQSIAMDSSGNLYVADTGNKRIRKITRSGSVLTVAGNGNNTFSGDGGAALLAALSLPQGVAVDQQGNVYIADTGNNRIRKVTPAGIITTIAGNGGADYSGDGGLATAAQLNSPVRLALDSSGNVYFSDNNNNVIRKISTSGIITTVAGNGSEGFSGDGKSALAASLNNPHGLAVDPSGGILICDSGNNRIRYVNPNGIISTVAGNGTNSLSGNGAPPLNTGIAFCADVSLDPSGNIYIADRNNARIRRIQPNPASLVLSETGFTFSAAVDASASSTHTISILNSGGGTIGWTAIASTTSGGSGWLQISPSQGLTSGTASPLTITANPAGLAAGHYYGQVQIISPGVINSPAFITVVLNVLSASQTTQASVSPAGFVFTGAVGAANPASQTLTVSKLHGNSVTFTSAIAYGQPGLFLTATPNSGAVAVGKPVSVALAANVSGLGAGVYTATLFLNFSDGTARSIPVVLSLAPAGSTAASRPAPRTACTPTKLVPVVTGFGTGFSVSAGWPVAIEAQVVDDCGHTLAAGNVTATFNDGDPPLALTSVGNGAWAGTWEPRTTAVSVTVSVSAQSPAPVISGTSQVGGGVTTNTEPPIINAGAVVNAASFSTGTAIAPGGLIAIFGSNLAAAPTVATSLPLPTNLGGAQVLINGQFMPLLYAGPGQINAVVPFDIAVGTAQVIAESGAALSVPMPTPVSAGGPGTFTLNGYGTGIPIVAGVNPDGSEYLVGSASPAHPGQPVVIYCTGLGGVQISIDAGNAAPLSPLAPANTEANVTVTVGGVSAQMLFAGLVPTLSGLYQVNAILPTGVSGSNVPLVITSNGQSSAPVPLPIQ